MKNRYIISIISIIITFILISGCNSNDNFNNKIWRISLYLNLDYNETILINVTELESNLSPHYYMIYTAQSSIYINYYYNGDKESLSEFYFTISRNEISKSSEMRVEYRPYNSNYNEKDELKNTKQYIKNKVNEVANVCGITVDWDSASWQVDYQTS